MENKVKRTSKSIILHCDMNNYFASVEEKYEPRLKRIPFAVCGDPEMRHSIVMAKNELAKSMGVITGMSYSQAKQICPDLRCVNADYPKYLLETKAARCIYGKYTDKVIPYGMDEAWIDLTDEGCTFHDAVQIADLIRMEIKYTQQITASVGVSFNYIFSKLGSDYRKPDAVTAIPYGSYKNIAWKLPANDMLFVGVKRYEKLKQNGIFTIGDIASARPEFLTRILGKVGYDLWSYANGDDNSFHPENDSIKSIGNTITPPSDINSEDEASAFIYLLVASVCKRLSHHNLKAGCISIQIKDNAFNQFTRQYTLIKPSDNINLLYTGSMELFRKNVTWYRPLRSVGVRADRLTDGRNEQLSLFDEAHHNKEVISDKVKALVEKFSILPFETSVSNKEWQT